MVGRAPRHTWLPPAPLVAGPREAAELGSSKGQRHCAALQLVRQPCRRPWTSQRMTSHAAALPVCKHPCRFIEAARAAPSKLRSMEASFARVMALGKPQISNTPRRQKARPSHCVCNTCGMKRGRATRITAVTQIAYIFLTHQSRRERSSASAPSWAFAQDGGR